MRRTKSGCKPNIGRRMPGASLSRRRSGKAPLGKPALQPYRGKPAVRNDREDRGNVGIIRSPVRASILPDYIGSLASEEIEAAGPCMSALPKKRTNRQTTRYVRFVTVACICWLRNRL